MKSVLNPSPIAIALSLSILTQSPLTFAKDRNWDDQNNPSRMDRSYIYSFDKLPLNGNLNDTKKGWSDSYWALEKGMISYRWQTGNDDFKKDKAPSASAVRNMSPSEINLLSPAEKYDLARSDLAFTLSKKIREDQRPNAPEWRGICNGWTQASLNFDEPKPFVYHNAKLGIDIPFGSSDLKALLAYYYAKEDDSYTVLVGTRCNFRMAGLSENCQDINPGAFHVVMSNELGIKHQGFAADRDPLKQIWNQPFVGFESTVDQILDKRKGDKLSKGASKDTVKQITVTSKVTYVDEIDASYDTVLGTDKQKTVTVEYQYVLDINYYGNITGGEWLSWERPDFIWKQAFNKPVGEFDFLNTLYNQSQAAQ